MLVISSTFPVLYLNTDFSHSLTFLIVRHNAFTMREPGGIRSCGMVRNVPMIQEEAFIQLDGRSSHFDSMSRLSLTGRFLKK